MGQGQRYGCNVNDLNGHLSQAFIVGLLVLSIASLVAFVYTEKKVKNPLMPLMLWRAPNFAVTWVRVSPEFPNGKY